MKELKEIRDANLKSFRDINVDESNILVWTGLIVPVSILGIPYIHIYYQECIKNVLYILLIIRSSDEYSEQVYVFTINVIVGKSSL